MNEEINQDDDIIEEEYWMMGDVLSSIALGMWIVGMLLIVASIVFSFTFTVMGCGMVMCCMSGGFNRCMDFLTWRH